MDGSGGGNGAVPAHVKGRVIEVNGSDREMRKHEISDRRICAGKIEICA